MKLDEKALTLAWEAMESELIAGRYISAEYNGRYEEARATVLDAARAAITAYLAAMPSGWQPIETAPRDGFTHILAYPVYLDRAGMAIWEAAARTPPMMRLVSNEHHDHDGYWRVAGTQSSTPYEPTHWMPLPPPPAAQGDSRAAAPDLAAEVIRLRTALNLVIENVEATGSSHADRLAAINVVVRAALTEQVS